MVKNLNQSCLQQSIIDDLRNFCCVGKKRKICLTTTFSELGIDGDDAYEFLEFFGENYSVDMSKFPFQEYFSSEGEGLLLLLFFPVLLFLSLLLRFWGRAVPWEKLSKELSIADLVFAAQRGYWE